MIHTVSPKPYLNKFESTYGNPEVVVRSPGIINVLGSYTDYNQGFVMPAAVDKEMILIFRKNTLQKVRIFAFDLQNHFDFEIIQLPKFRKQNGCANYILGVLSEFSKFGKLLLEGFDVLFGSDIPMGIGMASSAALCCGTAFGLNILFGFDLNKLNLVQIANRAEVNFMNIPCSIMDQYANIYGITNHYLKLFCRDMSHKAIMSHMPNYRLMIIDSQYRDPLLNKEKRIRFDECQALKKIIRKNNPKVDSLSIENLEMLDTIKHDIEIDLYEKGTFIIEENQRVIQGADSLERGDVVGFGKLMNQSHQSLKNKFKVSNPAIDFLIEEASKDPNLLGARFLGEGFGSCMITIFKDYDTDLFLDKIKKKYKKSYRKNLIVYKLKLAKGTSRLPVL